MHVNHVQLSEAPAEPAPFGFAVGDYYDVVAMPLAEKGGSFKVRFLDALALGEADLVADLAGVSVVAQDDPSFFYRDGAART